MNICSICNGKKYAVERQSYIFSVCSDCKAVTKEFCLLANNATNSESFDKILNDQYFDSTTEIFLNGQILLETEKRLEKEHRLLDIGCSNGAFLNALQQRGFINTYGIDIQEKTVNYAKSKGIKCHYGIFPNSIPKQLNQKYNIITSIENAYYMDEIHEFIKKCDLLLHNKGYLIIKFNQSTSFFYKKHPYHIRVGDFKTLISIESIKKTIKGTSFIIEEEIKIDNNPITDYLGYSSRKTKPSPKPNLLTRIINRITSFFTKAKTSDKVIVVLKKREQ